MPASCAIAAVPISYEEYLELDRRAMGVVFDVHNSFGRLHEEETYQAAAARAWRGAGLDAVREVPITVWHERVDEGMTRRFKKVYYADAILEGRILYEFKTVGALMPQHRQQVYNYLFLSGIKYGRLLNMRTPSVVHERITAVVGEEERHELAFATDGWVDLDGDGVWLRELIVELIEDWGGFLDVQLFYEAAAYFRGGSEGIAHCVEIEDDGVVLGAKEVHLLTPDTAIHFSALKESTTGYEGHLRRFLGHTPLRAMHWTSFARHDIQMKTLLK